MRRARSGPQGGTPQLSDPEPAAGGRRATGVMLAHGGEEGLDQAIAAFLAAIGKEQLAGPVGYCMREIVSNAVKANAKRAHFLARGIDLRDPEAYAEGMRSFRRGLDENRLEYFRLAEEHGLTVLVAFEPGAGQLRMSVTNNAAMTAEEAMSIIDETEGAGLGIIILALTLKKLGLGSEALSLGVEGGETVARLAIPTGFSRNEQLHHLSEGLSNAIGALPQFPEPLARLRGMLEDPMTRLVDMARHVAADPGLAAEVLRLANSPFYRNAGRIGSLANAVLRIGVNGMMGIVLAQGVRTALGGKGEKAAAVWERSRRCAAFAYLIARGGGCDRRLVDEAYLGALLIDMGKIVLVNLHPDVMAAIEAFCAEKMIGSEVLEELLDGANHAEIGALLAERWQFPPALVETIRWHHHPGAAPRGPNEARLHVVGLASCLMAIDEGTMAWDQVGQDLRRRFNITREDQVVALRAAMREVLAQKGQP